MKSYNISADNILTLRDLFDNLSQQMKEIERSNQEEIINFQIFDNNRDVDIKLLGENLMVGEILIPLVSRKVTLRLISEFLISENYFASRIELIEKVYGKNYRESSERMQRALDKNIMKLLSRTRSLLERSLEASSYSTIRWILYDEKKNGWYFYK